MQKKNSSQFNLESIKDPELRDYVQHLSNSLTRQNQENKILSLKNKIIDQYFQSDDLQQSLNLIIKEFSMPGCSSLRILVYPKIPFDIPSFVFAASGVFAEEYVYLDEQIVQQLKDKDQLIITDTTKIHSIKFSPERKYPKAIGGFHFLQSAAVDGFFWISFEAVKEFSNYELDLLAQFGAVLGDICANSARIKSGQDSAAAYKQALGLIDLPVMLINHEQKILFANQAARDKLEGELEKICKAEEISVWLKSSEIELDTDLEISGRHFQLSGQKLSGDYPAQKAAVILRDETQYHRKQAYLTLMMDTISHDFRGPLINMQGFSKLLGMVGELNPKQVEYLELIQDGIGELSTVTTDLLDVNRIIQDGGLKILDCNPDELVEKALALIQAEARQKRIEFESKMLASDQVVAVDRVMVISALYNLLNQAVKNSHIGGKVTIEESVIGKDWGISIKDEGKGISQIDIENLEANHFASKDTPGLSLVYRIAKFHQGNLIVESELGKGVKSILQLQCVE